MAKNKCWECLREFEITLESSKWKEAGSPLGYLYDMMDAEREFLKKRLSQLNPKTVLDIGAGAGRIIAIVRKNSDADIMALERDAKMYELVKGRFQNDKKVNVVLGDIGTIADKKFDLVLCMMNTLGNQKYEAEVIKTALAVSERFIFTLYKKSSDKVRGKIYGSRGHKDFTVKDSCFCFNDPWARGIISKSYSEEDIERLCREAGCRAKISDLCKIGWVVEVGQ